MIAQYHLCFASYADHLSCSKLLAWLKRFVFAVLLAPPCFSEWREQGDTSVIYCNFILYIASIILSIGFWEGWGDKAMGWGDSVKLKAKGPHMAAWLPSAKQRHAVRTGVQLLKWELGRDCAAGLGAGCREQGLLKSLAVLQ